MIILRIDWLPRDKEEELFSLLEFENEEKIEEFKTKFKEKVRKEDNDWIKEHGENDGFLGNWTDSDVSMIIDDLEKELGFKQLTVCGDKDILLENMISEAFKE